MKRIVSFAPHKTALTVAVIFALISTLFLIPMFIGFSSMPATDHEGNPIQFGPPIGFMIAMPFFYFIFTYIFTVIGSFIYNKIAKYTGGIVVDVEVVNEENS